MAPKLISCLLVVLVAFCLTAVRGVPPTDNLPTDDNVLEFLEASFQGILKDKNFRFGSELRDASGKLIKVKKFTTEPMGNINSNSNSNSNSNKNSHSPISSASSGGKRNLRVVEGEQEEEEEERNLGGAPGNTPANLANPITACDPSSAFTSVKVGKYNLLYQMVPALPASAGATTWAALAAKLALHPTLCVAFNVNSWDAGFLPTFPNFNW